MLAQFRDKLDTLLVNNFNIILFGENGCGKTTFLKEALIENDIHYLWLTNSHFVDIKDFFAVLKKDMQDYWKRKSYPEHLIEVIDFRKFSDLYDFLTDFEEYLHESYLIIDDIDDLETCRSVKKYLQKILALNADFPKFKIILVSNFDLGTSEMKQILDLSTFISICFPAIKSDEDSMIEILSKHIEVGNVNQEELMLNCIGNFKHNFANLNEYVYSLKNNMDLCDDLANYVKFGMNEVIQNLDQLSLTKEVESFTKEKNINVISIKEIDEFMDKVRLSYEVTEKVDLNQAYIDSPSNVSSNVKIVKFKQKDQLRELTSSAPIHLINLTETKNSETNPSKFTALYSSKNLTDSLSRNQKLLLLSGFFAYQVPPKSDINTFRSVKKTKSKIKKKSYSSKMRALKTKTTHCFTVHRLLAIYAVLYSITNEDGLTVSASDLNVELVADVNTLIHLHLLRYSQNTEYNFLSRKLVTNIGLDFAKQIADDFEIKLEDFINLDEI